MPQKIGWKRLFLFYGIVSAVISASMYLFLLCLNLYIYIYIYVCVCTFMIHYILF